MIKDTCHYMNLNHSIKLMTGLSAQLEAERDGQSARPRQEIMTARELREYDARWGGTDAWAHYDDGGDDETA